MAQAPHKSPAQRSAPPPLPAAKKDRQATPDSDQEHEQGEYKDDHVPLRDPSQGRSPAVIANQLAVQAPGEAGESEYPPPEPVQTIADEQRERSAYIESIGVDAYKDEVDNRDDDEKQNPQIEGVEVVKTGGGTFKDRPAIGADGTLR